MSGRVDDITEQLRACDPLNRYQEAERLAHKAIDEIERLRARVAELEATVNEWAGV